VNYPFNLSGQESAVRLCSVRQQLMHYCSSQRSVLSAFHRSMLLQ